MTKELKKPGKVGRPKKMINDPETLEKITELGSLGMTFGQIARALGISRSSLDRRRTEFEEIEEAIKKGESLGIAKVSKALMDSAIYDKNPTSMIFYLKNRSDKWSDRQEVNHNLDLANILSNANERIIEVRTNERTNEDEKLELPEVYNLRTNGVDAATHERTSETQTNARTHEQKKSDEG